jgi:hypothetical protein
MRIVWACAQQAFAAAALWISFVWAVHATDAPPSLDAKLRFTPSVGMTAGEIPVWKRVALGTYKNVNLLREDLDSLDCGTVAVPQVASVAEVGIAVKKPGQPPCNLGDAAAEIIGRHAFALSKTKRGLDLVVVTPADLGLEGENVAVAEIYARAELLGFGALPSRGGAPATAAISRSAARRSPTYRDATDPPLHRRADDLRPHKRGRGAAADRQRW